MEKRFLTDDNLGGAINLALDQAKESGEFDGAPGKDGNPGVYIGSGDMPEGYNVQIDPNGDAFTVDDLLPDDIVKSVNGQTGDVQTRLVVTITANEDGTYTSSHTSQEIYAAYMGGAVVFSTFDEEGSTIYSLAETCEEYACFFEQFGTTSEEMYIEGDSVTFESFEVFGAFEGSTATSAGSAGLVPAPAAGDGGKFLRGDGTWGEIAIPEGGADIALGISGAAVGQIARITAVDGDGVPTAWESVDLPEGGGGSGGAGMWMDLSRDPDSVVHITEAVEMISVSEISGTPIDTEEMAVLIEMPGGVKTSPNYHRFNNAVVAKGDANYAVANLGYPKGVTNETTGCASLTRCKKITDGVYAVCYFFENKNPGEVQGATNNVIGGLYQNTLGETSIKEFFVYQTGKIQPGSKVSVWVK